MRLSIVCTLYRSEPYLVEFFHRISNAAKQLCQDYEIIFVNDGSPDRSLTITLELMNEDPRIVVVDLSRNFGHHKAIMTGLSYAQGDLVFLIDCDLEEPPEILSKFWEELQKFPEVDVVFGVQANRKGGWMERNVGKLFYTIFNTLSEHKIAENQIIARLMRRAYVQNLIKFTEADLVLAGVCTLAGYRQKPLAVVKGHKDKTSYNLAHKLDIMTNTITSYSAKPLIWIFYVGAIVLILSVLASMYLTLCKIVLGITVEGWASLTVSIWLFGGLILFSLGVIGVYLAKIYNQVKNRPFTIVKAEYRKTGIAPLKDQVRENVLSP